MMDARREKAWEQLRQLRDFAQQNVGRTMEISRRMVVVLDEAVGEFQNDPPCPTCKTRSDDDIPL